MVGIVGSAQDESGSLQWGLRKEGLLCCGGSWAGGGGVAALDAE